MFARPARLLIAVCLVTAAFALATPAPAGAEHYKRIVLPYGLDERWVPVIAGFKVVPDPPACGGGGPAGTILYENSFEAPEDMPAIAPSLTSHFWYNLWHQTTHSGYGTDNDHDGEGRLYFGVDEFSNFRNGFRVSGAAVFPFDVPASGASYLSFNTKWSGEWLEGYDHMWIELQAENGRVYILCTLNPEGRGDPSSSETTVATCSPYRFSPCPNDMRHADPFSVGDNIDRFAPHWEARFVQIPDLFAGQSVSLRFTFDSADPVSNGYLGWMIDDVTFSDGIDKTDGVIP